MMSPRTSFKHRKKIYKRAFLGTYQNSFVGMDRKQLLSNILSIQNCLSKNQITEFLRTSENLKAEYLYLRNKTNRALQNHLKKVMSHNLSFLDKMGAWSEAFDIQKIDDDNFHMALIQTALEPVFIEQQREYLQFLYEVILPMVRDTPKEVREFFYEMVMASKKALRNMSLSEENLDSDDIDNIAINNFILYIINPLIFDMRINLVRFSHKEIKTLEEKETEFIKRNPNTNILPEQALIEGVIARMNSEKIERIAKTFHDPQRKIKENALTKLLQRTFKPPIKS